MGAKSVWSVSVCQSITLINGKVYENNIAHNAWIGKCL